jgi:parvulin-like peptidyl-prolyl isomerase
MKSIFDRRLRKLEAKASPPVDREAERRAIADWAVANPEEASQLIAQVNAQLLGDEYDDSHRIVPPEPIALRAFFEEARWPA